MFFRVFYHNIAIDRRLDGKHQLFRAIQYRNAAFNRSLLARALHCKNAKLIVRSLQIYVFGALYHDLGGFDARIDLCLVFRLDLDDITRFRGQRYILTSREGCTCRLYQTAARCKANVALSGKITAIGQSAAHKEIFDRDIP